MFSAVMFLFILFPVAYTKIPINRNPPEYLVNFLLQLSEVQYFTDVLAGFALNDTEETYFHYDLSIQVSKLYSDIRSLHFNIEDIPLTTSCKHIVYTNSIENLK